MSGDSLLLLALIGTPVVLGLLALVGGVRLLQRKAPGVPRETATLVGGVLVTVLGTAMLLVGLGVGACFGMLRNTNFH